MYVGVSHAAPDSEPWHAKIGTMVGKEDFAFVLFRYFRCVLQKKYFKGHPCEIVSGGQGGIEQGLTDLKNSKASAFKYVFRLNGTEGVWRGITNQSAVCIASRHCLPLSSCNILLKLLVALDVCKRCRRSFS